MLYLLATAYAVPLELPHQGRLLDTTTGAPLSGAHQLTLRLYDGPSSAVAVWTDTQNTTLDDGYYAVSLGQGTVLDPDLFDGSTLWLGIEVDSGGELPDRIAINSVPYALQARSVVGGVVDVAEIRVGGNVVMDSSGSTTLSQLPCSTDQVPLFDGTDWTCTAAASATVAWTDITGIPADFADDTDDTLSLPIAWADVVVPADILDGDADEWSEIANIPADLLDGDADDWSEIANIPSDLADGDADEWSEIANIPADLADGDADDWSEIANIPGDIADGDDDSFAGIVCADDEVLVWSGAMFICGNPVSLVEAGDLSLAGTLQVADTAATCDAAAGGTIRWTGGDLEVCNGLAWVSLVSNRPDGSTQALAAGSCLDIITDHPTSPSGSYWVDPNGGSTSDAFEAYCDMTTDGGGWTLVSQARPVTNASLNQCNAGGTAVGSIDLDNLTVNNPAKLADAEINNLWSSDKQLLIKIDNDSNGVSRSSWDRVCKVDFVSGYDWHSSGTESMANLETNAVTCFQGSWGDGVIDSLYSNGASCGYRFFESSSTEYIIYSFNTSYTPNSVACGGSPNAGRSWLGPGNNGCNATKMFVR